MFRAFHSLRWRGAILVILAFCLALAEAERIDPYRRILLNFRTADGSKSEGIAVLPRAPGKYPAVVFFYGAEENLAQSGNVLRKAADSGFAGVCLEYKKNSQAQFDSQMDSLLQYLSCQSWINTNKTAWLGLSLGARGSLNYCLSHYQSQPKLLVRLSAGWVEELDKVALSPSPDSPPLLQSEVLLINGADDTVFPPAECKRVAEVLRANHVRVHLMIVDHQTHSFGDCRPLVLKIIMDYSAVKLGVSIPPPQQAERVSLVEIALLICFSSVLAYSFIQPILIYISRFSSLGFSGKMSGIAIGIVSLAAILTALLPWLISRLPITEQSLLIARTFLVDSKSQDDFNDLAVLPCWKEKKVGMLLEHLRFARMQRQHFYASLEPSVYRQYLLSPIIGKALLTEVNWRRKLWEYFYPRVRDESDPKAAALRLAQDLRERIRVSPGFKPASGADTIWIQQATDQAGFDLLYVAVLRSVGIAARLNEESQPELWADDKWQPAPKPPIAEIVEE